MPPPRNSQRDKPHLLSPHQFPIRLLLRLRHREGLPSGAELGADLPVSSLAQGPMPASHSCPQLNGSFLAILKAALCLSRGQQLSVLAKAISFSRDSGVGHWERPDKRRPRTGCVPRSSLGVSKYVG